MSYQVVYQECHYYNLGKEDITLIAYLHTKRGQIEIETKLDTGAAFCLFERDYAERLGINVESGDKRRFGTLTGGFDAYGHTLTLKILEIELELMVFFPEDILLPRNLLGRNWLRLVRFGLVDYEGLLYLSAYDEAS